MIHHRELYAQLCQYAHLPGLWQPLGPDPPRCLYAFAWRPDCMQCWTLRPAHNPPAPLHATPCVRLDGTGSQGPTRLEFLDGRIVVLQQELPNAEGLASPHSDAVAAVAINTPGSDAEALGSSPAGSFAHEMAQFMRGRVDGRRSRSRRRMARSPSGMVSTAGAYAAAGDVGPVIAVSVCTWYIAHLCQSFIMQGACWIPFTTWSGLHGQ